MVGSIFIGSMCRERGTDGRSLADPNCSWLAGSGFSYRPKHLAEKILTSKSALEEEREQVTVLFADLKGLDGAGPPVAGALARFYGTETYAAVFPRRRTTGVARIRFGPAWRRRLDAEVDVMTETKAN